MNARDDPPFCKGLVERHRLSRLRFVSDDKNYVRCSNLLCNDASLDPARIGSKVGV